MSLKSCSSALPCSLISVPSSVMHNRGFPLEFVSTRYQLTTRWSELRISWSPQNFPSYVESLSKKQWEYVMFLPSSCSPFNPWINPCIGDHFCTQEFFSSSLFSSSARRDDELSSDARNPYCFLFTVKIVYDLSSWDYRTAQPLLLATKEDFN